MVKISGGEARFHTPVVYQPSRTPNPESRTPVDGHYRFNGHHVTFSVGTYDRTKPLVIDPALSYSTYLGGSSGDQGYGVAVDASGDAYVAGGTTSTDFPTTLGAFQTSYRGNADAFVTKLNPTGSALVYSTYLGGNMDDNGSGIAVDTNGDAYVTGQTGSTDFPTTPGVIQPAYGGNLDAYVTELNPTGSALIYSTYLGGNGNEAGAGINVDALGNAYVTGLTASANFPITPGAFQTSCSACNGTNGNAFVTELNPVGSALVYSTYLGGSTSDSGQGIALDPSGNAYVAGIARSLDFPTTPGAFQTALKGAQDAFLTKLNSTGSALVYSTYLGGSSLDQAQGIAVDASGNAYVTGYTSSSDFPTTPGAFQTTCSNCANDHDFVTKVDPTGSTLVYSTYLGGSGTEFGYGIAVDASDDAYVTGSTTSFDFPTTPGAFQTRNAGSYDASVTELNPAGSTPIYSTFLGGSGVDTGFGIRVDASGSIYIVGGTGSTDFPATPGAFQTSCGGGCLGGGNAFVTKFVPGDQVLPLSLSFGNHAVGTSSAPQTTTLSNSGTTPLSITAVNITGTDASDFSETNTCGTSLAAGVSCTISVTFTPTAAGTRTADVSITDSAANSPQTVSLTGVGTQGAVTFSPTSLTFPTQVIFTTSPAKTVTLTNSGNGTLSITSITITGNFSQTNTCGTSVAPGASCTISVKFAPKSKGTLTGTVSVTDNAPGSPQTVSLKGTGTYVQLVPASVNFGTQPVGTKSLPRKITLTNKGSVAVSISKISITGTNSGDFAETNTCGGSVAGGASCFITVTFTPAAKGKRTADVSISDNGGGSPQTVALSGTGT
ncbi:MAG TPA: choice-of-anchor D domain-containing protein [Terriglobia bacterium]|nr:choice-of-anchor D domain-containing protein [Terriglobia bacterium]